MTAEVPPRGKADGLYHYGNNGGGAKRADFQGISLLEMTGFVNGLDVENRGEIEMMPKSLS